MKAVPFINTMLNEEYRVYVLQPFNQNLITSNFNDWHSKDMVGWTKLTNFESSITIEFYGEGNPYKIKNPNLVGDKIMTFPYPKNLEEFICDCYKCSVDLHWNETIVDSMNRIYFMNQSEIEEYNIELLTKIEKI